MSPPRRPAEETAALRASLVDHARQLVQRSGPAALTMRALASEAGCAVGLPYTVFADRSELVVEICWAEFERLSQTYEELVAAAGTGTVAVTLSRFAELLLDSPAVALVHEVIEDRELNEAVAARVHQSGVGPGSMEEIVARYVVAEKVAGRVDDAVDADAVAFLFVGAIHNLVVSGDAYPQSGRSELRQHIDALAALLEPRS